MATGGISVVKRDTELSVKRVRMVHIRLDPGLHRSLRLIVAEQDTTLQDWISRTLEDAVAHAVPKAAPPKGVE